MARQLLVLLLALLLTACGDSAPPPTATLVPATTPSSSSPTAPPATSPPAAGNPLKVIQQHQYPHVSQFHIIGLVQNTGSEPLQQAIVQADIRDATNATIATDTDTLGFVLPPNGTAPFRLILTSPVPPTATVLLKTQSATTWGGLGKIPVLLDGLVAEGTHITPSDLTTKVTGRVRNGSKTPAFNTNVVVAAYDAGGQLVDVDPGSFIGGVNPLPVGEETPFEVFLVRQDVTIDHVEVLVYTSPK